MALARRASSEQPSAVAAEGRQRRAAVRAREECPDGPGSCCCKRPPQIEQERRPRGPGRSAAVDQLRRPTSLLTSLGPARPSPTPAL